MSSSAARAAFLFATSAVAGLGFAILSERVQRRETSEADQRVRGKSQAFVGHVAKAFGVVSGPLGKWYGHAPLAVSAATKLYRAGRSSAALSVVGASLGAIVLSRGLDRVLPHRAPPPGKGEPSAQSYPSGHALETTAVAIAAGYALVRERFAQPTIALPLGLTALASGAGRFALDRHWATDLLGGYLAGIFLGTACAGAYELAAGERR